MILMKQKKSQYVCFIYFVPLFLFFESLGWFIHRVLESMHINLVNQVYVFQSPIVSII